MTESTPDDRTAIEHSLLTALNDADHGTDRTDTEQAIDRITRAAEEMEGSEVRRIDIEGGPEVFEMVAEEMKNALEAYDG